MCGICAIVCLRDSEGRKLFPHTFDLEDLSAQLKRRGPDSFQEVSFSIQNAVDLHFISSVLHLRGITASPQPIKDESGNILLWNGEIFGGSLLDQLVEDDSDTKILSEKLFNSRNDSEILATFAAIHGPYAFIFYQNTGRLWFGRDVFGRRSLLWKADECSFCLSSIASSSEKWLEVSTKGIFCLDLKQSYTKNTFIIYCHYWSFTASGLCLQQENFESAMDNMLMFHASELRLPSPLSNPLNRLLASDELSSFYPSTSTGNCNSDLFLKLLEITSINETVREFEEILSKAVQRRCQNHQQLCKKCCVLRRVEKGNVNCVHASVGILFSGGLDSIVIACLADRHLTDNVAIDLMNVAFANSKNLKSLEVNSGNPAFNTPDRLTGKSGVVALNRIFPKRKWNFIEINVNEEELSFCRQKTISHLLHPSSTVLDDSIGCALWFAARADGVVLSNENYEKYQSDARKCSAIEVLISSGF